MIDGKKETISNIPSYGFAYLKYCTLVAPVVIPAKPLNILDKINLVGSTLRFHVPYIAAVFVWSVAFGVWRYWVGQ